MSIDMHFFDRFFVRGRSFRVRDQPYDLVATVPYIPADRLALSLGDTKQFGDVDLERFRRLAEKAGLPVRMVLQTVRETAARVRELSR